MSQSVHLVASCALVSLVWEMYQAADLVASHAVVSLVWGMG